MRQYQKPNKLFMLTSAKKCAEYLFQGKIKLNRYIPLRMYFHKECPWSHIKSVARNSVCDL